MARATLPKFPAGVKRHIAVFSVLVFFSASVAICFVHKHHPFQSVDPRDFDASCYWIKTDKAKKETSCTHLFTGLMAGPCSLLVVMVIIGRLCPARLKSRPAYTFRFHATRSPPASFQCI